MQSNLNTNLDENPLMPLLHSLIDKHRKQKASQFGSMVLDPGKFNLSATALESFGKTFEPEILKFFNRCGSLMQTQGRWWRSGLLYGKLSERIVQFSKILQNRCPWSSLLDIVKQTRITLSICYLGNAHLDDISKNGFPNRKDNLLFLCTIWGFHMHYNYKVPEHMLCYLKAGGFKDMNHHIPMCQIQSYTNAKCLKDWLTAVK